VLVQPGRRAGPVRRDLDVVAGRRGPAGVGGQGQAAEGQRGRPGRDRPQPRQPDDRQQVGQAQRDRQPDHRVELAQVAERRGRAVDQLVHRARQRVPRLLRWLTEMITTPTRTEPSRNRRAGSRAEVRPPSLRPARSSGLRR
jgi:hypothetical protein